MAKFTKIALPVVMVFLCCLAIPLQAQRGNQAMVNGCVRNEKGEPIIGASVIVVGTSRGVSTDLTGNYVIAVAKGEILRFGFLGKENFDVTFDSQNTIDVVLKDGAIGVEEVVVVGYGIQKKESVVGAISQVKGEALQSNGGLTSLSYGLEGLVPGLTTSSQSGKPGQESADIRIRGVSSWTSSAPLILVDGIEREMNDIDPNEVESMSVLKDASATAVYGVRGGNGVILITTKRGSEGRMSLNVHANVTAKTVSRIPTLLDSYNGRVARNFAIENQLGTTPDQWAYITTMRELEAFKSGSSPYLYPNVNWQDQILRKVTFSQKYGVDVSGGTRVVKYFGNLSYLYDGDILKGQDFGQGYVPREDYSRINLRSNFDFQITPTTVVSADIDVNVGQEHTTTAGSAVLWKGVWRKAPDEYPVRYEDGTFANDVSRTDTQNTVELYNYSGLTSEMRTDANASLKLKQDLSFLTTGLSLNGTVNFRNYYITTGPNTTGERALTKYVDPRTEVETWNYPAAYQSSLHGFDYYLGVPTVSSSTASSNVYQDLMYQMSLNYNRTLSKYHDLTALALFKRQEYSRGSAFPTYREEWAGRITYSYRNRYLLEGNVGYNGSEKFGKGNKFGFFPSMAAGWIVSNEEFFRRHVKFVDFLKVRYSWGKVGSDSGIAKWLYSTQWKSMTNSAKFGYPISQSPNYTSYEVSVIGNPDAKWETAIKNDVALESVMLDGLLSLSFDYYWGHRDGIFITGDARSVPPWFGASPVSANLGKTKNHGWELEAKLNGKLGREFAYSLGAAVSYAKGTTIYREDPELAPEYQKQAGKPIGQPYSMLATDIIKSWDQIYTGVGLENTTNYIPGSYMLLDYNGDGVIDSNDNVPCGYPNYPEYSFSFNLGLRYGRWALSALLTGQTNASRVFNQEEFPSPSYATAVDAGMWADMWIPSYNESGTYRHIFYNYTLDGLYAAQFRRADGTIWRLQTAELSYTLSGAKLKKSGLSSIKLFLSGNNIWLFTYLNDDRETGGARAKESQVDQYPKMKRYTLGASVKF